MVCYIAHCPGNFIWRPPPIFHWALVTQSAAIWLAATLLTTGLLLSSLLGLMLLSPHTFQLLLNLKWHLVCLNFISLFTSCVRLQEEEPQTTYPVSFTCTSHIGASVITTLNSTQSIDQQLLVQDCVEARARRQHESLSMSQRSYLNADFQVHLYPVKVVMKELWYAPKLHHLYRLFC